MDLEYVSCNLCGSDDADEVLSIPPFNYVKCARCGLVYLDRCLNQEAVGETTTDAERALGQTVSGEDPIGEEEMYLYRFAGRLKDIERLGQKGRILDVGSSWGHFLKLTEDNGWVAFGIEPSEMRARYARERFALEVTTTRFRDACFPDHHFDVVTFWHVLEHLSDPVGALRRVKRMLKKDGLLAIEVPGVKRLRKDMAGKEFAFDRPPQHLFYYTSATLALLIEKAGFRVVAGGQCGGTGTLERLDGLQLGVVRQWVVDHFRYFKWLKWLLQYGQRALMLQKNIVLYAVPAEQDLEE